MRKYLTLSREEVDLLLAAGYGDQLYRAIVVAPLLVLAGFLSSYIAPESAQRFIAYFTLSLSGTSLEGITLENISSLQTMGLLFINNFSAAFSALFWGLLPFLYLSAFTLGINFYLLGVFAATSIKNGVGLLTFLLGILPHGIFELPAIVLFAAAGLFLCHCVTEKLRGRSKVSIAQMLSICIRLLWSTVGPLLLISAVAETFLTPFLLKLIL